MGQNTINGDYQAYATLVIAYQCCAKEERMVLPASCQDRRAKIASVLMENRGTKREKERKQLGFLTPMTDTLSKQTSMQTVRSRTDKFYLNYGRDRTAVSPMIIGYLPMGTEAICV